MKLSFRKYEEAYFADLVRCIEQLHDFIVAVDDLNRCRRLAGFGKSYAKRLVRTVNSNNGLLLLACDAESVVGCIAGIIEKQTKENLLECVPTKTGRILELVVEESYRGKGIGKKLMRQMEVYFRQNDCDVVRVDVFGPNKKAREFYHAMDYRPRAIDLIKLLKGGKWP